MNGISVQTIITLAEDGARRHLADPGHYPRQRLTEFTSSLVKSALR